MGDAGPQGGGMGRGMGRGRGVPESLGLGPGMHLAEAMPAGRRKRRKHQGEMDTIKQVCLFKKSPPAPSNQPLVRLHVRVDVHLLRPVDTATPELFHDAASAELLAPPLIL